MIKFFYLFSEVLSLETGGCIVDVHRSLGLQSVEPRVLKLKLDQLGEGGLGVDQLAAHAGNEKSML